MVKLSEIIGVDATKYAEVANKILMELAIPRENNRETVDNVLKIAGVENTEETRILVTSMIKIAEFMAE